MKSRLFYIFIILASGLLIYFAFTSQKRTNAIVASVESQKTAISFQKAVQIKAIHVNEGQQIKEGQLLLEVERPDLIMDRTKIDNDRKLEISKKNKLESDYNSKLKLLDIEIQGKVQRLESEIAQLEAEIKLAQDRFNNVRQLANSSGSTTNPELEADKIKLESLKTEKTNLLDYSISEKRRFKELLDADLKAIDLRIDLIDQEEKALQMEESTLKQYAPFDGTIGNVNAQLMELIEPFETIISLYEPLPTTIKAYINQDSKEVIQVGQVVSVESVARPYNSRGEVIEIGARIVQYVDPSLPPGSTALYGKEVFIRLPSDNQFLYGEQVYVYLTPTTK